MGATTDRPVRERGLTAAQAAERLQREGANVLPTVRRRHPAWDLLLQMTHLFAVMLWVAAGLALLAGMPQLAVAIAVVVVLNGVFAFLQAHRAERAASRLRQLVPAAARVRRDGATTVVPVAELVVGDVVLLDPGARVGADLRLGANHGLSVDESLLTGESVAVHPSAGTTLWCGTFVVEGEAEGTVTATDGRTRLARIARLTTSASHGMSPLTRELHGVVRAVSVIAAVVGTSLFGISLGLGLPAGEAFLFGLGVTVALVPEGLLPTVTLSLARAAQRMAERHVLVRRLDAVETLGATTFICTDKTGTLTLNEMSAVAVWTPRDGEVALPGAGYDPTARTGLDRAVLARTAPLRRLADAAASCVRGRAVRCDGSWQPQGDPMEVALDVLSRRLGGGPAPEDRLLRTHPYTAARRRSSVVVANGDALPEVLVLGPPEVLRDLAAHPAPDLDETVTRMAARALRVVAVGRRRAPAGWRSVSPEELETGVDLLGLIALEDPPRGDVADAVARCREAGIRVAVVTGDHPATALAVAQEVGLAGPRTAAVTAGDLPQDDQALASLMRQPDGVVVARVGPEDKLRIARALQGAGEVVAMTGDGVNDGPALRTADVGVAMGASGSDVAREAADIVLLDDHFAGIVAGIELGRATFRNIRRFLTYHLTDNVAELAPFALWALTAGRFPLAIGVLQVLALDIGTDLFPALALGAEPPSPRTMKGPVRSRRLVGRRVLGRAFGLLGPVEAAFSLATFAVVLNLGGWRWGETPGPTLLATASGSAFVAITAGQLTNAVACRSESRPVWRKGLRGNTLLAWALLIEVAACVVFVATPAMADLLGGARPQAAGVAGAAMTAVAVAVADGLAKSLGRRPHGGPTRPSAEDEDFGPRQQHPAVAAWTGQGTDGTRQSIVGGAS